MVDEASPDQQAVLQKYKSLENQCRQFVTKITELELERNEHDLVIKTLTPLSPSRAAFRLVGGVLVERTVQEVLPSVVENRANIAAVLENLQKMLEARSGEMKEWKAKHNIKTQEEAQAEERKMQQERQLEGQSEVA
ncbi:hypothetical protein TrRE_jg1149 [Triparma retinervis]|uniref:Prefoldin subunit 2 n=1 Tax=Triparma retinervis TaxID=2557542 RepID=A0A9W7ABH8_9STRA|nr:hypothetical protein TrRE_jg1149 [Triparma retinervis]